MTNPQNDTQVPQTLRSIIRAFGDGLTVKGANFVTDREFEQALSALIERERHQAQQELLENLPAEGAKVWAENERYKLIYGELPETYGKVDLLTAYKAYREGDSFRENFGRYVEAARAELEKKETSDAVRN